MPVGDNATVERDVWEVCALNFVGSRQLWWNRLMESTRVHATKALRNIWDEKYFPKKCTAVDTKIPTVGSGSDECDS